MDLLQAGAHIDAVNASGKTPAMEATGKAISWLRFIFTLYCFLSRG